MRALGPHGLFVATDRLYDFPLAFLTRIAKKKVVFNVERPTKEDILLLKELLEAGKYRAVIDRTYPLEDVVEATKYVDTFQKVGNIVLTVGS
jgi:NADPH:quinone reductase-like Zn-dependent oxidoreductase